MISLICPPQQLIYATVSFVVFFISCQLVAALALLAVLVTSFAARLERNIIWANYLITWVVSAISYALLALAGQQIGPQPPIGLCLAQAILLYGAPPLTAFSGASLIIQACLPYHPHLVMVLKRGLQLYFDVTASLGRRKPSLPLLTTTLVRTSLNASPTNANVIPAATRGPVRALRRHHGRRARVRT
jgi:hypothetical protein